MREKRVPRRRGEKIPRVFGLHGRSIGVRGGQRYVWGAAKGPEFRATFSPGGSLWLWYAGEEYRGGYAADIKMAVQLIEATATGARERFLLAARAIQRARSRR